MAWGLQPFHRRTEPVPRRLPGRGRERFQAGGRRAFTPETPISPSRNTSSAWARTPTRWGRPMASLLGALDAQVELGVAAIGGKDSMSGSFENIDVPPTLVSFAVAAGNTDNVVSPEFKLPGSKLVPAAPGHARRPAARCREPASCCGRRCETLINEDKVLSAYTPVHGRSWPRRCSKWRLGNRLGVRFAPGFDAARAVRLRLRQLCAGAGGGRRRGHAHRRDNSALCVGTERRDSRPGQSAGSL